MRWSEKVDRTALTAHGERVHIVRDREPYLALCGVYVLLEEERPGQHEEAKAIWLRGRHGIAGENYRCARCCRMAANEGRDGD